MAELVKFDQDPEGPEGAGQFHFDNGRSFYALDPMLASSLRGPDERLAANDIAAPSAGPRTATDAPSPFDPLSTAANAAKKIGGAWLGGVQNLTGGASPAKAPEPPVRMGVTVPPPEEQTPVLPKVRQPSTTPQVRRPQAPMSGEALDAQDATQAARAQQLAAARAPRAVPKTETVTTEGTGAPYNPEDMLAREKANQAVVGAQLAQFDLQRSQLEREAAAQRAQIPQLEFEKSRLERERKHAEDEYKIERAKAQTYVDAASKREIDPRAFFKEQGFGASVLMVIGQALGAFASAITRTDNYAARIVENAIQQNIAAQEKNIESGKIAADNMLARITKDLGGNIEAAKSLYNIAALELVNAQIKEQAASTQLPQVQQAAQLWLAQNFQSRLLEEQKFRDASIGKTKTERTYQYQAPPGPMTAEQRMNAETKRYKSIAEWLKAKRAAEGGGQEVDDKAVVKYAESRQSAENILGQVKDIVKTAGGEVQNGRVEFQDSVNGVPGVGPIQSRLPSWLLTDRGNAIRQSLGNLAADVVKDKSGAAVTDAEREILMNIIEGSAKTEEQFRTGLGIIQRYGERKIRNVEAGVPAQVRNAYRQWGAEAQQEDADQKALTPERRGPGEW